MNTSRPSDATTTTTSNATATMTPSSINETQLGLLAQFIAPKGDALYPDGGILTEAIKDEEKVNLGTKLLYLERAITLEFTKFNAFLDMLYTPGLEEFIRHLKKINDLCFNNTVRINDEDSAVKNALQYTFGRLGKGKVNPALFQAKIKEMITATIKELKKPILASTASSEKRASDELSVSDDTSTTRKRARLNNAAPSATSDQNESKESKEEKGDSTNHMSSPKTITELQAEKIELETRIAAETTAQNKLEHQARLALVQSQLTAMTSSSSTSTSSASAPEAKDAVQLQQELRLEQEKTIVPNTEWREILEPTAQQIFSVATNNQGFSGDDFEGNDDDNGDEVDTTNNQGFSGDDFEGDEDSNSVNENENEDDDPIATMTTSSAHEDAVAAAAATTTTVVQSSLTAHGLYRFANADSHEERSRSTFSGDDIEGDDDNNSVDENEKKDDDPRIDPISTTTTSSAHEDAGVEAAATTTTVVLSLLTEHGMYGFVSNCPHQEEAWRSRYTIDYVRLMIGTPELLSNFIEEHYRTTIVRSVARIAAISFEHAKLLLTCQPLLNEIAPVPLRKILTAIATISAEHAKLILNSQDLRESLLPFHPHYRREILGRIGYIFRNSREVVELCIQYTHTPTPNTPSVMETTTTATSTTFRP